MFDSFDPKAQQLSMTGGPITDEALESEISDEDRKRAQGLYGEIMQWVLGEDNLPQNVRVCVLNQCHQRRFAEAEALLMDEFSNGNNVIPPSEPTKWIEWRSFWQRGFVPDQVF